MSQGSTFINKGVSYQVVDTKLVPYWKQLPYCLKVLMENVLRHTDHQAEVVASFERCLSGDSPEVMFRPSRVLMQDLTGVPAIVDLAEMRDCVASFKGDVNQVYPQVPVDLVVDHSVSVDFAKDSEAFAKNVAIEVQKNKERYALLKWAQKTFDNINIVPPGKGICHQVNLEYLATVVTHREGWLFPDTLVGLDSHTTMINGLGVLGWGVGGIEAEAAMLGQPISIKIPKVVQVVLSGSMSPGVMATDVVLSLTAFLREKGVVGQFVEFVGEGAKALSLAERATIANMAPEFGATAAFFPVDEETIRYLRLTGRDEAQIELVEAYTKHMGLYHEGCEAVYSRTYDFDLRQVETCVAGPKRPEQNLPLRAVREVLTTRPKDRSVLTDGSVVIAAITSCTNTSNPSLLIACGLLAKRACELGLTLPDFVKPSIAPGSKVVVDYLRQLDLIAPLEQLGFYLVGFGCTTCIGNSGPLEASVEAEIQEHQLQVASVLSGNRNFEGRVHPLTQLNYLASPPLVIAYALAGNIGIDFENDALGEHEGKKVYLRDIWPSEQAIQQSLGVVTSALFQAGYKDLFSGTAEWDAIKVKASPRFVWQKSSTYIRCPGLLLGMSPNPAQVQSIIGAQILAILGDSVTTDHISPAGVIATNSPAAEYLRSQGVEDDALHSYGARRGNAEVMVRGTLANIRLRNKMVSQEGGYTIHHPSKELLSIYDCAMRYQKTGRNAVIFAGQHYGTGSSRDWAAKGVKLLGVRAVIAESFERIHRSNLIGMGVLPCALEEVSLADLNLQGNEFVSILGLEELASPQQSLALVIHGEGEIRVSVKVAIETQSELTYYRHGGILAYVVRSLFKDQEAV